MIAIETHVSQVSNQAHFNVYNDNVLALSYEYSNSTGLTSITELTVPLEMPLNDYIKNVGILQRWVNSLELNFSLHASNQLSTSRNYDYDFGNHFRRATFIIDSNEFKVRYNYNTGIVIVRPRQAFVFNFSELFYFTKCHIDFYSKNDLFA